jgi:hypothetical protein
MTTANPLEYMIGQILLVVFVIGLFCRIADMRPDPVISGLFELARAIAIGIVRLFIAAIALIAKLLLLTNRKPPRKLF